MKSWIYLTFSCLFIITVTLILKNKLIDNDQHLEPVSSFKDNIYINVCDPNITEETIFGSLSYRDTVTYEMENDILVFIPTGGDEYKIYSERSDRAITVLQNHDAVNFLFWVYSYPLPEDMIRYPNWYYHEIITEKIWE